MTYKIVRTIDLRAGQPVVDFFTDKTSAATFITSANRRSVADPATEDDLAGADEWPYAVVPVEPACSSA